MALPDINFSQIERTAKDALLSYGTPVQFFEGNDTTSREIKVVIYKDDEAETFVADVDSKPATAILNPDDFVLPNRMPRKFDKIVVSVSSFSRTYTIESVHPIFAQSTLPLILVQLKAN